MAVASRVSGLTGSEGTCVVGGGGVVVVVVERDHVVSVSGSVIIVVVRRFRCFVLRGVLSVVVDDVFVIVGGFRPAIKCGLWCFVVGLVGLRGARVDNLARSAA